MWPGRGGRRSRSLLLLQGPLSLHSFICNTGPRSLSAMDGILHSHTRRNDKINLSYQNEKYNLIFLVIYL